MLLQAAHSFNPVLYRRMFSLPIAYIGMQARLNSRLEKAVSF